MITLCARLGPQSMGRCCTASIQGRSPSVTLVWKHPSRQVYFQGEPQASPRDNGDSPSHFSRAGKHEVLPGLAWRETEASSSRLHTCDLAWSKLGADSDSCDLRRGAETPSCSTYITEDYIDISEGGQEDGLPSRAVTSGC